MIDDTIYDNIYTILNSQLLRNSKCCSSLFESPIHQQRVSPFHWLRHVMAAMVSMSNLLNGKDSRWLQLEVCREFQRNKCSRPDTECKFAHPPANVEVQNGRVTACYDSIKVSLNLIRRDDFLLEGKTFSPTMEIDLESFSHDRHQQRENLASSNRLSIISSWSFTCC